MKKAMVLNIALLLCCIAFTGCGTEPSSDKDPTLTEHTHSWSEWTVVKDAACTESGVSSRTCACGEKEEQTIPATGHTYENGICKNCGMGYVSEGLKFTINSDNQSYTVTGIGTYEGNDIAVPSTYNGKPVTGIGKYAFFGCSTLTGVTIGNSVTSIGESAFSWCSSLTGVTIGNGVKSIGGSAFSWCSSLTNIVIPESVTSIGVCAFLNCSSLTNIVIPDSITSIGESAFSWCSSLTNIVISESVTSIGVHAFLDCSSLTDITFQATRAQWNAINKGSNWNWRTGSYTVHCTDGDFEAIGE